VAVVKGITAAVTRRAREMDAFLAERFDAERCRRDSFRRLIPSLVEQDSRWVAVQNGL
jgi:hypothetical protein